jgi:hypothetical protein
MKRTLCIFAFASLLFSKCNEDDPIPPSPTSLVATIDGEVIDFDNPRVILKTRNGIPQPSQIAGEITSDEMVDKALNLMFSGDLGTAAIDSNLVVLVSVYYEDDYSESWSNIAGPGGIDLTISQYSSQRISGFSSDFIGVNGSDTLLISDISFTNIPIRRIDL